MKSISNCNFADKIAGVCLQQYAKLPKSGKPCPGKEWTLLSAVLVTALDRTDPCVVAMATGSKCIGRTKLSADGDILNDSHAEVLVRRALLRYIYYQVELVVHGQKSEILHSDDKSRVSLKPGIQFHFFTSHIPCGDASIFPKNPNLKRTLDKDDDEEDLPSKRLKSDEDTDIHRTGAKCVTGEEEDPKGAGAGYHSVGTLRTKPGRGDPTLSMSCSDKMAKWNVCGLQGALLSRMLDKPIYLTSVTVGKCAYCVDAMRRALVGRSVNVKHLTEGFSLNCPEFHQSVLEFESNRSVVEQNNTNKVVPCSSSIIWCNIPRKPLEVSVNGRRQGVTAKNMSKPSARLSICKAELFKTFCGLVKSIDKDDKSCDKTYGENKKLAENYQQALMEFRKEFANWTSKPQELLDFKVE